MFRFGGDLSFQVREGDGHLRTMLINFVNGFFKGTVVSVVLFRFDARAR